MTVQGVVRRQGQPRLLRALLRTGERGQGEDGRRSTAATAAWPRRTRPSRTAATSRCRGRCSSTRRTRRSRHEVKRRVRQVLRRQLRHDRRAGEVRPDDRRAGAAGQGRPSRSWRAVVGSDRITSCSSRSRRARGAPAHCCQAPRYGEVAIKGVAVPVRARLGRSPRSASSWRCSARRSSSSGRSALGDYFTGTSWAPLFSPSSFGVLPLVVGTLSTTFWACVVALPFGLGAAIYLSEYAKRPHAPLPEARARGAGRHPDRRLRLLRAHVRHPAAARHRARRSRSSTRSRPGS